MYCRNCNAFNEDGSRFCSSCGAPLEPQPQQAAPQQGAYTPPQGPQPPYQQPYYGTQPPMEPTKPLTSTLPIVALILSILSVNVISILLGAFSLVNFNRYTAALRAGDFGSAEQYKARSRRLATISLVVTVVMFVLGVILGVAGFVFLGFRAVESGGFESPLVEFNLGDFTTAPYGEIPAMLRALF